MTPIESEAFSKDRPGEGGRFEACATKMMSRTNPRTKKNYTKEEADKICASIGRKAYGKERFQTLAAKGSPSCISATALTGELLFDEVCPNCADEFMERFLVKVANDGTIARRPNGGLVSYTKDAHKTCAESFIGSSVVLNHDGDLPGGVIFDSWSEDNGDLFQVWHIYNRDYAEMLKRGFGVSIKAIPTEMENDIVKSYIGQHTSILLPGNEPGCEECGLTQKLESSTDKTIITVERESENIPDENKEDFEAKYEALQSSIEKEKDNIRKEITEKYEIDALISSISISTGVKGEVLNVIKGGGKDALNAFQSSINEIKKATEQTIISQKSEPVPPKEKEPEKPVKTINDGEKVVDVFEEDVKRYEATMSSISKKPKE